MCASVCFRSSLIKVFDNVKGLAITFFTVVILDLESRFDPALVREEKE